jgi:two-component system response regulator HydG
MARILLVDDDPYTQSLFAGLLRGRRVELHSALNVAQARQLFRASDFNLAILDQRLPDGNGLDLFADMRRERPRQMAILITGYAEVRDAVRAVHEGLFDYLTKPFENLEELEAVIDKALEMDRAYREIATLQEALARCASTPALIGRSVVIEQVLQTLRQAAPLDTSILIEGESGTGKELFAKQIHALSPRAQGPMLELNCGALSESLLEATLFGYEKGAFTGAGKTTAGYFEEADGGTLLLDEITDMSPKLQASLLRVLQEHTFARIGSTAQRPSDFRLICATNKPLQAEVQAGNFRADLYYRINVVKVQVPPLRQRPEDIMPLALFFLDHFNRKFGKDAGVFSPPAIAAMEAAVWPGNVRELKHAVERAVVVNVGARAISPEDLGLYSQPAAKAAPQVPMRLPLREAREQFERDYFTALLQAAPGNISEAARLAGISRQNLYTHLHRLGVVTEP